MKSLIALVAVAVVLAAAVSASALQSPQTGPDGLPPGHPPMVPAGHPPLQPQQEPAPAAAAAHPEDVASATAVVAAYYASISGVDRDWGRFQSLFLPGARLVSTTGGQSGGTPIVLTPDLFARMNRKYFQSSGYSEKSVSARSESFGNTVHVWSTYESRRRGDAAPYSRGINSFQLLNSSGRWWIVSVMWDRERPGVELDPGDLGPAGE